MAHIPKQDVMIYGGGIGPVRMVINPDNWNLTRQKIENRYLTKGGITFQHWGEDIPIITIAGYTDVKSTGTRGLELLKRMWLLSGTYDEKTRDFVRITIVYKGITYTGHFQNFSYRETTENLYLWRYDMRFLVEEMNDPSVGITSLRFEGELPSDENELYPTGSIVIPKSPIFPTEATKPSPSPNPSIPYVVQAGDTLSGIAAKYGLSWSEIYNYKNNKSIIGPDPNLIRPGMVLEIPLK